jgi:hypothetical protein
MAEYLLLAALVPGIHIRFKRVRGKLRLVEVRLNWPWMSKPHKR